MTEKKKSADEILSEIDLGEPSDPVIQDAEKAAAEADLPEQEIPSEGPDEATDLDDNETGLNELEIPDETPSGPRIHIVSGGETLSMIARSYGVDRSQLVRVNKDVTNLRHLVRGQELKIDE